MHNNNSDTAVKQLDMFGIDVIEDRFLTKAAALDLFNQYGYDIGMTTFHNTIWQELTKKPVSRNHRYRRPSTLRVLYSECMKLIRRDMERIRNEV